MAVCGVCGPHLALVDVDTKNGATIAAAEAWLAEIGVSPWAKITSPSGGAHFYLPGHPLGRNVPADATAHLPGLPGVELFGGRHFAYLPGTQRPKYQGRGYTVEWLRPEHRRDDVTALWAWVDAHPRTSPSRATAAPLAPRQPAQAS